MIAAQQPITGRDVLELVSFFLVMGSIGAVVGWALAHDKPQEWYRAIKNWKPRMRFAVVTYVRPFHEVRRPMIKDGQAYYNPTAEQIEDPLFAEKAIIVSEPEFRLGEIICIDRTGIEIGGKFREVEHRFAVDTEIYWDTWKAIKKSEEVCDN